MLDRAVGHSSRPRPPRAAWRRAERPEVPACQLGHRVGRGRRVRYPVLDHTLISTFTERWASTLIFPSGLTPMIGQAKTSNGRLWPIRP